VQAEGVGEGEWEGRRSAGRRGRGTERGRVVGG